MDPVAATAEAILRYDPAPGLPLARLTERLRARLDDARLTPDEVRHRLEAEPTRFRILDLERGVLDEATGLGPSGAWVAVLTDPAAGVMEAAGAPPGDLDGDAERRLRDSVRWLSGSVDARSLREVARWRRLLVSERRTRAALSAAGERVA